MIPAQLSFGLPLSSECPSLTLECVCTALSGRDSPHGGELSLEIQSPHHCSSQPKERRDPLSSSSNNKTSERTLPTLRCFEQGQGGPTGQT